jgi:transposase-like protein
LLRREKLYSNQLSAWRREYAEAGIAGLSKSAPEPAASKTPEQRENEQLRKQNDRLTRKLEKPKGEEINQGSDATLNNDKPKRGSHNPTGIGGKAGKERNDDCQVDNVNLTKEKNKGGNRAEYLISRLKRDAESDAKPQGLLQQIETGDLSARQAAHQYQVARVAGTDTSHIAF